MAKRTRYDFLLAEERGTTKTIAANTTLTTTNINIDGNSFIKINGAYTLTLPAAETALKGTTLIVAGNNASSKVYVVAGFGGGVTAWDTVTIGAYNAAKFYCDGSYWYALSEAVAAS